MSAARQRQRAARTPSPPGPRSPRTGRGGRPRSCGGVLLLAALCAAFAALLAAAPARATAQQAPPIETAVALDRETVSVGDRVLLTVTVTHGADVLVHVSPPQRTAALRVVRTAPEEQAAAGDGVRTRFAFELAAFAVGAIELPVLRLDWLRADGVEGVIDVGAPGFTVQPLLAPGDNELRPLKPQQSVGGAPAAWVRPALGGLAVAALLALAALATVAARRRWARRATVRAPAAVDTRVEDAARARLDALAAADALGAGDYDRYYGQLGEVVRDYLEARFAFTATALTTTELERLMTGRGVERWQARLVGGLLERCDAAVYAGQRPDPASADHDLTVAFEIIELARPRAVALDEVAS